MTSADVEYLREMVARGYLSGPCLEMGVALEGTSVRTILQKAGLTPCCGTDIAPGHDVDVVVNFERPAAEVQQAFARYGPFGSVVCLNVLEHTFEPIRVLDNIFSLLRPGGTCVVIAPARWPLHAYPVDCWRLLPDFYMEYARRRDIELVADSFAYVGHGPIDRYRGRDGRALPPPAPSRWYRRYSHVIHRAFHTFGRHHWFAELAAVGVVLRAPQAPRA